MDALADRLLPKMLVENPVAVSAGEQRLPIHPLVGQVDAGIATFGILAGFQLDLGRQATINNQGAQSGNDQRLLAILHRGTHVRVHLPVVGIRRQEWGRHNHSGGNSVSTLPCRGQAARSAGRWGYADGVCEAPTGRGPRTKDGDQSCDRNGGAR